MKVIYNAMVLKEPYSGVEVTVHQLADAFSHYGTLPICACVPHDHRAIAETPRLRLYLAAKWASRSRLMRILWEQTVLPVLLSRTHATLLHSPAYVAPLLTPCPFVLTIHDLHVMTHPQFCGRENRLHYNLLIPSSIRRASAIITFSSYTKKTILSRFPEAQGKITVIPPGLSQELKRCDRFDRLQSVKQKYSLPTSFLLFVGDLSLRKNILGLIHAFAIVQAERPDLHLVLAGAADPSSAHATDKAIRHADLAHRIHRIGYVAQKDLGALYSLAKAFVFPSHDEGFGLPPLEAMACGCPVVCSGGAAVENCGDAAVICDPLDPASIASAVSLLLDHPEFRQEKVSAGYTKAAAYTWETATLATEAVYRSVCGKTSSASRRS